MGTTPEGLEYMAQQFINRNPVAWEYMKREAARMVSECRRFSISRLAEESRYNMRLNGHDEGFKLNNSCRSVLARMLIKEIPGASDYLETRKSKVDR